MLVIPVMLPPGSVEAGDQSGFNRVLGDEKDDWDGRGRGLSRAGRRRAARSSEDGNSGVGELGRQCRQSLIAALGPSVFDRHVLALDIAALAQSAAECPHTIRDRLGRNK
jgi:hypothetical protein